MLDGIYKILEGGKHMITLVLWFKNKQSKPFSIIIQSESWAEIAILANQTINRTEEKFLYMEEKKNACNL